MAIAENVGNLRFALQSAKGTAASASDYGLYIAGGSQIGAMGEDGTYEESTGARMRSDRFVSERHAEGTMEFYVTPKAIAPLMYAALGANVTTGAGDPYAHAATPATTRPWMTWWRNTAGLYYERSTDVKVNTLTITGESGQPLRVSVEAHGLFPEYLAAEETTASIDTADRLLFYDGDGALQMEGAAVADIRAFTLTISNNGELVPGDSLTPIDVSEGELQVTLNITKLALTSSLRNRLYYGSASPSNLDDVVSDILELGSDPSIDFKFSRVGAALERSLQIELKRVALAPFDVVTGTGNSPLTEDVTLECLAPSSGDAITATTTNGEATIPTS